MAGQTVGDAMNTTVVTVSAEDTLRAAARRMSGRSVGAAVVADSGGRGLGILTERDVLDSIGRGEDIDEERVRDNLARELIYAFPGWRLERAAEKMEAAGVRHVVVTDKGGRAIGILSMRDIVRCWISGGGREGGSAETG